MEIEKLIAVLEARTDRFDKALSKASGNANRQFKKIEDRGAKMEANLARLGIGFAGPSPERRR